MRSVFLGVDIPDYLDEQAKVLLANGRAAFGELGLGSSSFIDAGKDTHLLTWCGSATNAILAVLLTSIGFECETFDVGVTLTGAPVDDARDVIASLEGCPPVEELAPFVTNLGDEKYDRFIPDGVLRRFWVMRNAPIRDAVTGVVSKLQLEL